MDNIEYNSMQKEVLNSGVIDEEYNLVLCSPTGSGKTLIAELYMQKIIEKYNKICVYIAPLKALAEEKFSDWSKKYPNYKITIITSDYELTDELENRLQSSNIAIFTCENFYLRAIKHGISEKSVFLSEVGLVVVDELHTISSKKRGANIESMLMAFSKINNCPLLFMSATLSKTEELKEWTTSLNSRETVVVNSDYRPVKINIVPVMVVSDIFTLDPRVNKTIHILNNIHPKDQAIVFTTTRNESFETAKILKQKGISCEVHNALVAHANRKLVEQKFLNGDIRVVVASPTLSQGINLPAKVVIIQNVFRGVNELDSIEINQMIGRAGRIQYMTENDEAYAYVIYPTQGAHIVSNLSKISITSTLLNFEDLLFHINNLIYSMGMVDINTINEWYNRSFAYTLAQYQNPDFNNIDSSFMIDKAFNRLIDDKIIVQDVDSGLFACSKLGTVAAMFGYHPYDVITWYKNIKYLEAANNFSDIAWSFALVHYSLISNAPYVTESEKSEINDFISNHRNEFHDIMKIFPRASDYTMCKYAMYIYSAITDEGNQAIINQIRTDAGRMFSAIKLLAAKMGLGYNITEEIKKIECRMVYGLPEDGKELLEIDGVGRKRAQILYENGFRTKLDIANNEMLVYQLFGQKIGSKIVDSALGKRKNIWRLRK